MNDVSNSSAHQVPDHLSQITTIWTALIQAHGSEQEAIRSAQVEVFDRYGAAVFRYLLAALHDEDAAQELFQEFALRFVQGDFKNANPERGRFRAFVKTALFHLIIDYRRRQSRRAVSLDSMSPEPVTRRDETADLDREFVAVWRAELMNRTWDALRALEQRTGQPLYSALRMRFDYPQMDSRALAGQLQAKLGRPVTPVWARKQLHLARRQFSDLLLQEVARSLTHPTRDCLEQELVDLEFLDYCRDALTRRSD
jgi:RNA polymerase sigma factor (sigma-70 family)